MSLSTEQMNSTWTRCNPDEPLGSSVYEMVRINPRGQRVVSTVTFTSVECVIVASIHIEWLTNDPNFSSSISNDNYMSCTLDDGVELTQPMLQYMLDDAFENIIVPVVDEK